LPLRPARLHPVAPGGPGPPAAGDGGSGPPPTGEPIGRPAVRRPGPGPARIRVAAALVALLVASAPAPARAQGDALPEELRTIAGVRFEGLHRLGRRQLSAAGLRTRRPSRLPWRERPTLRRDYLRADSAAIVSLYRHYGYLDAAVEVRLQPGHDPRSAIVVFDVQEGSRTRVGTLAVDGVGVFSQSEVRRPLLAQPGRPYDPAFLQLDALKLRAMYQEHGYFAVVDTSARRGVPDASHVGVRYDVDEGPQYRVGRIDYLPGPRVRESLGRRELLLKPGDVFRRSRLDRSVERLYGTGLFRQVQVSAVPDSDSTAARIDVLLRVTERAPRWVDIGVGSGTTNRYQVTGEVGHRNIDTRALGLVLDGQVARDGQNHPRRESGTVTLSEPWFLGIRLLAQSSAFYISDYDRSNANFVKHVVGPGFNFTLYRELSHIARVTLVQENVFARQSYQLLGDYSASVADSLRRAVLPSYRTHTLRLTLERDLRDDKIAPRRGSYQTLTGELAGGPLKGTSYYHKGILSSVWYTPMRNGWTFAARATGGVMRPFGNVPANFSPDASDAQVARVPRESRFFIGGVNSMRGYAENGVPATGGLAMGLLNLEWRIPLAGPLGLEAFMDAGNVWARPEYIKGRDVVAPWNANRVNDGDIRYTYGIGGRLVLPHRPRLERPAGLSAGREIPGLPARSVRLSVRHRTFVLTPLRSRA
jgi:outer membrane protein assembly factor BamA